MKVGGILGMRSILIIFILSLCNWAFSQDNCSNPDSNRAVILYDSMEVSTLPMCYDTISLSTRNVGNIQWVSYLDGSFSDENADSILYQLDSAGRADRESNIILTINNECGVFKDTLVVTYYEAFFNPSNDTVLYIPGDVPINFNLKRQGASSVFSYNTDLYLEDPTARNTVAEDVRESVDYIMTVQTDSTRGGCVYRDTISVEMRDSIWGPFLPQAFTPNGDDDHDILYVRIGGEISVHFQVFDRWEKLLFESSDKHIGWDGTYNGINVGAGIYTYTVRGTHGDGTPYAEKGKVTLLR